jgi:XTP/dITP diphosphohydrolase
MTRLIVASRNHKKIKEIEAIARDFGLEVISRDDAGLPPVEIEETGDTFEENALLKAVAIMELSGSPAVADDSGLEVDWLSGAPGVYSARFAGEACDDLANNRKLLELMAGVPSDHRTARFVSAIALAYPDGRTLVVRGVTEGRLLEEARGAGGFGYDPLFVPEGYDRTYAELPPDEKNRISHRGKALAALKALLLARAGEQGGGTPAA